MISLLRAVVREVARLPLTIKFLIGLGILIEFIIVTQWENLTFKQTPVASKVVVSPQKPEQRASPIPTQLSADKAKSTADEAALTRRMARVVIEEPNVEPNGTIIANGQAIYLHGIKQFDSKKVCTKASGDRWACGLHAYAALRNSIARKKITCDPKTIMPNGVSAICRMGTTDIALSLVRDGLVELDDNAVDVEMTSAQASAKSRKLGIWDR